MQKLISNFQCIVLASQILSEVLNWGTCNDEWQDQLRHLPLQDALQFLNFLLLRKIIPGNDPEWCMIKIFMGWGGSMQ